MKKSDILSMLDEVERRAKAEVPDVDQVEEPQRKTVTSPPLAAGHKNDEAVAASSPKPLPAVEAREPEKPKESTPIPAPVAKQEKPVEQAKPVVPVQRPAEQQVQVKSESGTGNSTPPSRSSWHDHVPTSHKGVVGRGLLFVFGFLAVFLAWALFLPISSAVVASGKIISTGQNKLVQHQVGGVVQKILVKEGDKVTEGDVLVQLDDVATKAELSRLLARKQTLEAQKLRYEAEQGGAQATFPGDTSTVTGGLRGGQDAAGSEGLPTASERSAVIDEQRKEFDAGRKRLSAQLSTIQFQIETLKDEKSGLQARLLGNQKLLKLTQRDLGKIRPLANDGYLPKSRLWDIEKTQLEQLTEVENLTSQIAATDQKISEAESKLAELDQSDREKRSEELTKVIGELAELKQPIEAARRAMQLTELKAPASGTITNLAANTEGGVVPSGDPVAEIVPTGAQLQTEFRVPLNKSKYVKVGQPVRIVMSTFNRRLYDPIDGAVSYVSADSLEDPQTGETYFLARAKLIPAPEKTTGFKEVSAGMATEIYVLAEPRVFASYVLQPLIDSFNRAFREI